jgi:1-phosphofructokinase/tagatose 6-phosphate kinase
MEWGPLIQPVELEVLLEKLDYLARGAKMVVFAGSLPRGVDDDFYAEAIRTLNRRGVLTVLDSEGEPLRLGLEAEPFLVSPNRLEAEAVVGQEFSDDSDFLDALDRLEDLGARNALITDESGCFASVRGERGQPKRFRAEGPHLEAVSRVGSGAVLLAGFISAWLEDTTPEDVLRKAVAAGAASTLQVGAGRFDPRDVGRILRDVRVAELAPVASG